MSYVKKIRRIPAAALLMLSCFLLPVADLQAGDRWGAAQGRFTARGFSWSGKLTALVERAGAWIAGNPAVDKEGAQIDGNGARRKDVIVVVDEGSGSDQGN